MPLFGDAQEAYRKVWQSTIFTSLFMVIFLLRLGNIPYAEFVQAGRFPSKKRPGLRDALDQISDADIDERVRCKIDARIGERVVNDFSFLDENTRISKHRMREIPAPYYPKATGGYGGSRCGRTSKGG